jgi:hypothetical protein
MTSVSSTPMKKIKSINENLKKLNTTIAGQSLVYKEAQKDNTSLFYDSLQEKLRSLQESVEEERKAAQKLNSSLKDKQVDFLGMKNFVEDKVAHLINDIKLNGKCKDNDYKFCEVIDSIDTLLVSFGEKKRTEKIFTNLEMQHMQIQKNADINEPEINLNNLCENKVYTNNNQNQENIHLPSQKNKKGKLNYFGKFSF